VLAALMVLSGSVIMYAGRHLTFFSDEWDLILGRRGAGLGTYLDPLKGHLALFQIVVYKLLFAMVGLRHYAPYLAVTVALHLLCGVLLYMLARRRLGPWLGLAPRMSGPFALAPCLFPWPPAPVGCERKEELANRSDAVADRVEVDIGARSQAT